MNWRLLVQRDLPGYRQMAIDEALYISAATANQPVLRLYTWERPTLSLGYFQNYKSVVCEPFCVHNNIHVVRRFTGGRSVLHHLEMTYAIAAPLERGTFKNCSLQETYQLIARALDSALQNLGVTRAAISFQSNQQAQIRKAQCFVSVSQFELAENEKKIIGSAQKRSRNAFLQHGSILFDFDFNLQQGCVNNPDPEIEMKIAPLRAILGRIPDFDEARESIIKSFEEVLSVKFEESDLESVELEIAKKLESKYRSSEWTRSPLLMKEGLGGGWSD
jgi:lipoate-protein ligase A